MRQFGAIDIKHGSMSVKLVTWENAFDEIPHIFETLQVVYHVKFWISDRKKIHTIIKHTIFHFSSTRTLITIPISSLRLIQPAIIAKLWGERSGKPDLCYNNFARVLR